MRRYYNLHPVVSKVEASPSLEQPSACMFGGGWAVELTSTIGLSGTRCNRLQSWGADGAIGASKLGCPAEYLRKLDACGLSLSKGARAPETTPGQGCRESSKAIFGPCRAGAQSCSGSLPLRHHLTALKASGHQPPLRLDSQWMDKLPSPVVVVLSTTARTAGLREER